MIYLIEKTKYLEQKDIQDWIDSCDAEKVTCFITTDSIDTLDTQDNVVFHCSIEYAKNAKMRLYNVFFPGDTKLGCDIYYRMFDSSILLNANNTILTKHDLLQSWEDWFNMYKSNILFIRPNSGDKQFTGGNFHLRGYQEFTDYTKHVDNKELLLIASSVYIKSEYRFVICNKEVVTGSRYKLDGFSSEECTYPDKAFYIANKVAKNNWQPDVVYTVDIGQINDEYKVIELNSFSTAGLYSCDKRKIIRAINKLYE